MAFIEKNVADEETRVRSKKLGQGYFARETLVGLTSIATFTSLQTQAC